MSYVFHNLSDGRLAALEKAVQEERKRRFLAGANNYPKLADINAASAVNGVKAYRDAYSLSLGDALKLFNFHHR